MRLFFALGTLGLVACQDYTIEKTGDVLGGDQSSAAPDIVVDPQRVDFGAMDVSAASLAYQEITVRNQGDAPLQISGIRLEDESAPFTISAISTVLIPVDGTASFTVTFEPTTSAAVDTRVLVASNDPDTPEAPVRLTGEGVAPAIEVTPESYDFGTLYIGCDSTVPLTISNVGTADLVINTFDYVTASEDLAFDPDSSTNGALPWTIAPGGTKEVYVGYAPFDLRDDAGLLTIGSNDPLRPEVTASQTALGDLFGDNLDVFEQPIRGMTDIIFALDWSCSMDDDIANVQANFSTFVSTLATMDADYHVGVVVRDTGCFIGGEFLENTMAPADQLSAFNAMVGTSSDQGSYTEMGLTLVEAALSSANLRSGGCNEDFLRDDATLAVVGVTDEVEQSANPWSYYVSLYQSFKDDPDDVLVHAIAGDMPSGCGGNEPGRGWYEASVATGGLFLSICATDWASTLEALAEGSAADLTSFALTQTPVPETITVRVDGITTTAGWTYDASTNMVVFEETSVPDGGSTIEIDYALQGSCEG